ncbi:ATP-binding protein [Flavobacterium sp. GT3R68]|uniref:ATP-binding protein n=1 Tax=Flavobacterium sp. GT3R68 TaxID=2594437 RepID=UPI000F89263D|nr:ATP-binding protein [Flavobacterium sp. GT3R68]RTY86622.1 response regulator [Flavobacterium sp. GSN2]TRW92343.1 response regulator [Flavobacterium sp. GT3R68]
MIKFNFTSTYSKIISLIVLSSVFFILLLISIYYYTVQQEKEVYETTLQQFKKEAHSLLALNSSPQNSSIQDMTYWDELVEFIDTKSPKWFDESIRSTLALNKVDYISIYDLNADFITRASSSKIKSDDFIPKEVIRRLHKSKFTKFYMKMPEGIIEVFGATIHPSNDPLRKSRPRGYFFMARVLDANYFNNLEKISSSKITFIGDKVPNFEDKKSILVSVNLKDWQNHTVATLLFKRHFDISFKGTKNILYIFIIAFLTGLFLYLFFSKKWINRPLKLITSVLETGNKNAIASLIKIPGEFGYIGNLFEENVHQRKLLEIAKDKAEESEKLKSAFLTNMSHEIRTPMNAIIGFSNLLNNPNLEIEDRLGYIKVINQSGADLVSIIDDLIEMSMIETNQIKPNYGSVDLESCIKELYDTIKITIPKEKKIDFYLIENTNPGPFRIFTDEIKLKQILNNLITNAIKFTDEGFVAFGYEINRTDATIQFTIKDSGLGIDKEFHNIVFDRFRRVDGDYSIKVGGLGLGLAICKAYAELLGGTISIQSQVGVGSVFSFSIPLNPDLSTKSKPEQPGGIYDPVFKENTTILIAEDDNINFLLLQKMMQLKKCKIIRAVNGHEAVEICKNNEEIDLVLMDIKMPKLSGYEAFERIKSIRPALPVIAQTAYSSSDEYEKIKKAGFVGYISKPINKEKLFALIAEALNTDVY